VRQELTTLWARAQMGLASYLVNETARQPFASAEAKRIAGVVQTLYWIQLGLNMLWRCVELAGGRPTTELRRSYRHRPGG
jgi:hypothetical protein